MCFELSTIDWTAISSIISALVLIATFISIRQNRKQLLEIKRQWREEHRPIISITIESKNGFFLLCVKNEGNAIAFNVNFHFNEFLTEKLMVELYRNNFRNLEQSSIVIAPHCNKYFTIHPNYNSHRIDVQNTNETYTKLQINEWYDKYKSEVISVACVYSDQSGNKYNSELKTKLADFFLGSVVVVDNITDAILELNKTIYNLPDNLIH